jgi:hypothetical protein
MLCREIFNPSPQNILFIPALNNQTHSLGFFHLTRASPTYQRPPIFLKTCVLRYQLQSKSINLTYKTGPKPTSPNPVGHDLVTKRKKADF